MWTDLGVSDLAHATAQGIADEQPRIDRSLALEILVVRKGDGFANPLLSAFQPNTVFFLVHSYICGANDGLVLVAGLGGESAMRDHHFGKRMDSLAVARCVRCNLCGLAARAARALKILANLLTARTRCVEVLLSVALDFRCAAAPGNDLVAKLAKPVSQLRLINGRGDTTRRTSSSRPYPCCLRDIVNGSQECRINHRRVDAKKVRKQ